MKEDIKNVLLMGLGAISLTGEKASEIKKELLEKGEALYKEGSIKNEELKRDIKEKIKDNTNIQYTSVTKEDLVDIISTMSDEEKEELSELLKSKKENFAAVTANNDNYDINREFDPVQTDNSDSKYLFDNENAIIVNFKNKKK